jgi:Zn finger protein HypA/HybF involved in hydrogenase expression
MGDKMETCDAFKLCAHDIGLINRLLHFVLQKAAPYKPSRIVSISLEIGHLVKADLPLFQDYFHHISKGTLADNAELNIRRKRQVIKCPNCDLLYFAKEYRLAEEKCPRCNEPGKISKLPDNIYVKAINFI